MKLTARDVIEFGGCSEFYQFHVRNYEPKSAVDFETLATDIKEYIESLPEDSDLSWVDLDLERRMSTNYAMLEKCGEKVEILEEYRTSLTSGVVEGDSLAKIHDNTVKALKDFMVSPEEFFNLKARYEVELFNKVGVGIFDIDDPRTEKLKLVDYTMTDRDAKKFYAKDWDSAQETLAQLESKYIDSIMSELIYYQKIVADDKYEAWKPVS